MTDPHDSDDPLRGEALASALAYVLAVTFYDMRQDSTFAPWSPGCGPVM